MFHHITFLEPVALNAAYRKRGFGKGMYMVDAGKTYKEGLFWEAKMAWKNDPLIGDLTMDLIITRPNHRSDIDSYLKLTLDALQTVVYKNDRQIKRLMVDMEYGPASIEIYVKKLTN